MFSLYFNVCNFGYFQLCLGGSTVILIEAVPSLCLPVTIDCNSTLNSVVGPTVIEN